MSIKDLKCECCLGQLKEITPKHYKCESCDKEYVDHIASEEEVIWLINANQTLRKGNFDDAYEEFSNIVSKYPECYEAYFGMSLCTHGIMYVDDVLENKKVPVCYNISTESILDDIDYQKVLKYSPEELKENYLEQARKIELIRTEWLEKASKEEPYDIFISFKQSDAENNLEKTKDFYSALGLYTYLVKRNYNVFFAPESLKGKLSERYEPYIYNALNTSKVMIVYGEKPEYFQATWVKNEWIRYLRKIKNQEKAPESIIVMYKGFNANQLPKELKQLQALDVNEIDYLETLMDHITKVIESSYSNQKLERKEIKVGQIATRSRTIGKNQIVKRELGTSAVVAKDATVAKTLESIEMLVNTGQFEMAKIQIESVIQKDSENSKLKYLQYLNNNYIRGTKEFITKLESEENINLDKLNNLIATLNKEDATNIIKVIKDSLIKKATSNINKPDSFINNTHENDLINIYSLLLGYDYEGSEAVDKQMIDVAINKGTYLKLFNLAIRSLNEDQIDEYINYNLALARNIENQKFNPLYIKETLNFEANSVKEVKQALLQRNLDVDNGHDETLLEMFKLTNDIKYIELLLGYSEDKNEFKSYLLKVINEYILSIDTPVKEILQIIPVEYNDIYIQALEKSYQVLKNDMILRPENIKDNIDTLRYVLEQLINKSGETSERLVDQFTFKLGYVDYNKLIEYPVRLKKNPDFVLMLPKLEMNFQKKLVKIIEEQERIISDKEFRAYLEEKREEERIKKEEEEKQKIEEKFRKERSDKRKKTLIILLIVFSFIVSIVLTIINLNYAGIIIKQNNVVGGSEPFGWEHFTWIAQVLWVLGTVLTLIKLYDNDTVLASLTRIFVIFVGLLVIVFNMLSCSEVFG